MMAVQERLVSAPGCPVPEGSSVAVIRAADGLALRAAYFPALATAAGTVLILPGRSEFIEKYFETVGDLRARGFAVAVLDWRGQGGSERELANRAKGHVDDFALYRRDLEAMLDHMAGLAAPQPWYGLAHSMGGTVLISALAAGESRLARVVLSAPMVGIHGVPLGGMGAQAAAILNLIGLGGRFVPFAGGRAASAFAPFAGNILTSDARRYERSVEILTAGEHLTLGPPTIAWVAAALRAIRAMADLSFGLEARCPSLFVIAGADRVVDSAAAEDLASRMRGAAAVVIGGAQHELLMEADRFRGQFWAAFDAFIH